MYSGENAVSAAIATARHSPKRRRAPKNCTTIKPRNDANESSFKPSKVAPKNFDQSALAIENPTRLGGGKM
jgi:hypothetical protein